MQFTTFGYRQIYTVGPSQHALAAQHGKDWRDITPLTIVSDGRLIDTDRAAFDNGWSEDEKLEMERHLMRHPDFGTKRMADTGLQRGDELVSVPVWVLWFADTQGIPDEHREFCEQQRWFQVWTDGGLEVGAQPDTPLVSEVLCADRVEVNGDVLPCPWFAVEGSDYCEHHQPAEQLSEVPSG